MIFHEVKIKDIATILNGRAYKQNELLDKGKYRVLRVGNFFTSDNWYFSDLELEENKYCNYGDLLYAWSANFGPKIWNEGKTIYHYHIWKIDLKDDVDKNYLYYYLKLITANLKNSTHGSVMLHLTKADMENQIIKIPDYINQKRIGMILSKIDKKIELNNKINDNLHEIILSIYNEKIRNNTNNIFEFKTLDEICNVFTGKKNANASDESGKYKFFTCAPEPLTINSYIYDGPAIIIAGNGAYTGRTTFYNGKFDLYQRTYAITEKELNNYIYVLYAMVKSDLQENIMGGTHGSAIPYIVMNDIAKFKIKYNKEIFDELSNKFKSFLNKIKENEKENTTLIQLRDTLLPKLMNGEIDLDKIEI